MIKEKLPCEKCYPRMVENWLNHQAGEGKVLTGIKGNQATFEEVKNHAPRYHVDLGHPGFQKLLKPEGWDMVCKLDPYLSVYRSDKKESTVPTVEIDTSDWEVLCFAKQKEERRWFLKTAWIPLLMVMLMSALLVFYKGQQTSILLRDDVFVGIFAILAVFVIGLILMIRRIVYLWEWFAKRLDKPSGDFYGKIKARQDKEWNGKDPFNKRIGIAFLSVIIVELIVFLIGMLNYKTAPLETYKGAYVTLSDIEDGEVESAEVDGYSNYYISQKSIFVPRQEILYQGGYVGEDSRALRTTTLVCASEEIASSMLQSRMSEDLSWNSFMKDYAVSMDELGADEAFYAGYNNMQYLYFRQGKTLTCVFYLGKEKLNDRAALFVK